MLSINQHRGRKYLLLFFIVILLATAGHAQKLQPKTIISRYNKYKTPPYNAVVTDSTVKTAAKMTATKTTTATTTTAAKTTIPARTQATGKLSLDATSTITTTTEVTVMVAATGHSIPPTTANTGSTTSITAQATNTYLPAVSFGHPSPSQRPISSISSLDATGSATIYVAGSISAFVNLIGCSFAHPMKDDYSHNGHQEQINDD